MSCGAFEQHHFATCTGTAPLEDSSGEVVRNRLSRAGNRQLNHPLHVVALAHKRYDDRAGEDDAKKLAAGKGREGALRCLERRLADQVFRHLVGDRQQRTQEALDGTRYPIEGFTSRSATSATATAAAEHRHAPCAYGGDGRGSGDSSRYEGPERPRQKYWEVPTLDPFTHAWSLATQRTWTQ